MRACMLHKPEHKTNYNKHILYICMDAYMLLHPYVGTENKLKLNPHLHRNTHTHTYIRIYIHKYVNTYINAWTGWMIPPPHTIFLKSRDEVWLFSVRDCPPLESRPPIMGASSSCRARKSFATIFDIRLVCGYADGCVMYIDEQQTHEKSLKETG
jgi:hypothetical protein